MVTTFVSDYITALNALPDDWKALPFNEISLYIGWPMDGQPGIAIRIEHPDRFILIYTTEEGWQAPRIVHEGGRA